MAYREQDLHFNGHVTGLRTAECRTHSQIFRTRPRRSGLPHKAIPGQKPHHLAREMPLTVNKLHRSKSQKRCFQFIGITAFEPQSAISACTNCVEGLLRWAFLCSKAQPTTSKKGGKPAADRQRKEEKETVRTVGNDLTSRLMADLG